MSQMVSTFWVKIYTSGPLDQIKQICRKECMREGLCVTIDKTDFIYTGGEEPGAVIGLINYPRFPNDEDAIYNRAEKLAVDIMKGIYQKSILIMTPFKTIWLTNEEA